MELPTGTVTLLFSDMEGSTRLLDRLGSEYVAALDGQRRILRQAWAAHGGTELGTEGDSFFVVFPDAPSAVTAAVDAQRGLAAADWPGGERILVRIGIHSGAPVRHDDGYVGMDVHRAARVMSAARGGQVLVTDATAALVHVPGVGFHDLGRHTLKDLPEREHLFQVEADGLASDLGPVRSLGSTSNLPVPATPLVGRDEAVRELADLVLQPHRRLVTLTGPGGTGKTRLATALAATVAGQFDNGVYFVALETVRSPDVMWTTIAAVLDVPPEGRVPPGLFEHIAHRSALLVLDNLEQVRDAATVVRELLEAAPGVRVVATSREPLHVAGEQEYAVPPLAVPEADTADAEDAPAVQLFLGSARLVKPSFAVTAANREAVLEVCRRLDGLPLALELAAARLKLLTPQALLARLDQALDLRSPDTGRASRHQTLRQTIAWSYELLDGPAQRLFRCLSVFAGSADLAAVEAVWTAVQDGGEGAGADALDLLQRLVDASLVNVSEGPDDEPRVGMLRTVAAFAAEELSRSPDDEAAHEAFVGYFDALMRSLETDHGPRWRERLTGRLETEHQNYRACLAWLLDRIGAEEPLGDASTAGRDRHVATALQLAFGLDLWLLSLHGYNAEGLRWNERVTAAAGDRRGLRMAAVTGAMVFGNLLAGRTELAMEQAEAAYRMLDDETVDADLPDDEAAQLRFTVINAYAQRLFSGGDLQGALELLERVVEETASPLFRAVAIDNVGMVYVSQGRLEESLRYTDEAERLAETVGDDYIANLTGHHRATTLRMLGRAEEAERQFRDLLPRMLSIRDPLEEAAFGEDYAACLADLGRPADAALVLGAADAMRERIGMPVPEEQEEELGQVVAAAKAALGGRWEERFGEGRRTTVEQALTRVMAPTTTAGAGIP